MKKKSLKPPATLNPKEDSKAKALLIVHAVVSKHAQQTVLLDVQGLTSLTHFLVICTAESEPQMKAITDAVHIVLSKYAIRPIGIEGTPLSPWRLVDHNDVILHIFRPEARAFYNVEGLWPDATSVPLTESSNDSKLLG